MTMGSDTYHEPYEELREATRTMHRAVVSLMEELEAVDWYQQRADATNDAALRDILLHNKDEEIEHAVMTLEWLRRNDPAFDEEMRKYLFTEGPITELEDRLREEGVGPGRTDGSGGPAAKGADAATQRAAAPADGSLGIGSLR